MISVITGATGCLGLNLSKRLLQEGHEVIALGRNLQFGRTLTDMGATFIAVDLREKARLQQITRNADLIFHCAALSSPWGKYKEFHQANIIGTQHIIEATPATARLIHVSSPSIYFNFKEKHHIKEGDPLPAKSANHYVKTKRIAESLIDKAYSNDNLNVITLRPRAIFGPYDRAILPRLLQAEKNGILPIIGSGENIIDITCVDNVVESLILAAQADSQYCGKKYNITNDEPMTLNTIITTLFTALQKPLHIKYVPYAFARKMAHCLEVLYSLPLIKKEPPITPYTAGVLALGQTLNIDAAKLDLGYRPIVSIDEGIKRFAAWYQS
jgi:nucleoside-diphosphate-sugar epimerase